MSRPPTSIGWVDPRTKKGEVIDTTRFPPQFLGDLKRRLGPYGTAGQLQQEPAPKEGGIIKRSWIKHYEELQDGRISVMDGFYQYDWKTHLRFCTVDLAVREDEIGGPKKGTKLDPDYTVMAAWSVLPMKRGPILILLDLIRDRMEAPDIIPQLKAFHKEFNFNVIGIETVQYQLSALQYARREGLPVREIARKKSDSVLYFIDADKAARAMRATPLMADGRFWVPSYKPWLEEFVKELTTFPNGSHDDMVDVAAYAVAIAESISLAPASPVGRKNGDSDDKGPPAWLRENQRKADRARRFGSITHQEGFTGLIPDGRRAHGQAGRSERFI